MKEKERLLETLLKILPVNIYWKDRENIYLGCNERVSETLKLRSSKEIIGQKLADLVPEDKRQIAEKTEAEDRDIMENNQAMTFEEKGLDKDGNIADYLTTKSPILDEHDNVIGLAGISIDITAEKKLRSVEEELKIIEQKNEILRALSGSIAHEIRTPLYSMSLANFSLKTILKTLVSEYDSLDENDFKEKLTQTFEITEEVDELVNNSQHIVNMHLYNIRGDVNEKELQNFHVGQVIQSAIHDYPFPPGMDRFVNFSLNSDFTIYADLKIFKHVIWNLLKNAIYSIQSAKKGEVYIEIINAKGCHYIKFKDTGQGISADTLPNIFKEFFTTKKSGTGIGLSFCERVLKTMGASISCESKLGEYTEFTILFKE